MAISTRVKETTTPAPEPQANVSADHDEAVTSVVTEDTLGAEGAAEDRSSNDQELIDGLEPVDETSHANEPKIGSQGDEADGKFKHKNSQGLRIAMMNDRGNITIVDDDTALILHRNPAFYREMFDSDRLQHIPTNMFTWVDGQRQSTGLVVGQPYDKDAV